MKLKGNLPSYRDNPRPLYNPNPLNLNRSLPPGKAWIGHSGLKARIRNLKQICKPILSSKDPLDLDLFKRVKEFVGNVPQPEYGFLLIIHQAKETAEASSVYWQDALEYLLTKIELDIKAKKESNPDLQEPQKSQEQPDATV